MTKPKLLEVLSDLEARRGEHKALENRIKEIQDAALAGMAEHKLDAIELPSGKTARLMEQVSTEIDVAAFGRECRAARVPLRRMREALKVAVTLARDLLGNAIIARISKSVPGAKFIRIQ